MKKLYHVLIDEDYVLINMDTVSYIRLKQSRNGDFYLYILQNVREWRICIAATKNSDISGYDFECDITGFNSAVTFLQELNNDGWIDDDVFILYVDRIKQYVERAINDTMTELEKLERAKNKEFDKLEEKTVDVNKEVNELFEMVSVIQ